MFPGFMELILIKEGDTVNWKQRSFFKYQQERVFLRHETEHCKDLGLKRCKNRQIDQGHKVERIIPNINGNMEYDRRETVNQ
jgi:hypothetical protein